MFAKCKESITKSFLDLSKKLIFYTKMFVKRILRFSYSKLKIPIIDVTRFIDKQAGWQTDCRQISKAFHEYGLVIIKDPRVSQQQNDRFLDLMESYFVRRSQQYFQGNRNVDFSPESNFQVGIMHQYQQKFQAYELQKRSLRPPNESLTPISADRDPKWRYHWKVDYSQNIIPKDFPSFEPTMNSWGKNMKNGCLTVAEMTAIGLGLQNDYLSKTIANGAFMLSPTAVDLQRTKIGDILAAFHRDFDLLTIHGKARFPGLYAWLNTGEKFLVSVPEGHLLLQAGKQLEWFTGGHIKAGFHQVIYTEDVEKLKNKALSQGKIPWRISSTMFCQVQDSIVMQPHPRFATEQTRALYKPMRADDYLNTELYYLTRAK